MSTWTAAHATLPLATEAAGAPNTQWVHLLPVGHVFGRDGRGPYVVRNTADIIEASRQYAGRKLIAIDYDHQIDHAAKNGKPAPAAGWIKGLQARSDGIWGLADWTARAAAFLERKEYRYLSPVFAHSRSGEVIRLLRASLTNDPNLELTALASAGGTMEDSINELRELMGLPPDAGLAAVTAAVRDLVTSKHTAAPDLSKFVPIGDFERVTAEMNKLNKGVSLHAAEIAVAAEIDRGRMPPFLRDWGISLCSTNKPAFDAFVERTSGPVSRLFTPEVPAHPPGDRGAGRLMDEQRAVCAAMGHTEDEYITFGGRR